MIYTFLVFAFLIWLQITLFRYFDLKEDYEQDFIFCADELCLFGIVLSCLVEIVMLLYGLCHYAKYCKFILHNFVSVISLAGVLLGIALFIYFVLLKKKWDFYKRKRDYEYKMVGLQRRLTEIKKYIDEVKYDATLSQEDREKTLQLLKTTKKALKKTYSNMRLNQHMMQIKDTLEAVNTTAQGQAKEDLQEQLDILDSMEVLDSTDELVKKYQEE